LLVDAHDAVNEASLNAAATGFLEELSKRVEARNQAGGA
jgi:hypothetical protein